MSEWDDVADSYEQTFEKTTAVFVARYLDVVAPGPGVAVLDVAAGPGVLTMAMANAGATVTSTDLSAPMVERLSERAGEVGVGDRVDAFVADAQSLPVRDGCVDAAVSNFGIIFCPDIGLALREMARAARRIMAFTAWTDERHNGWTLLLPDDYADALGFELPPRPMYKFASRDELRAACEGAGWADVQVELMSGQPTVFASWEFVGAAIDVPASKVALASLNTEQKRALRRLLETRAQALFGNAEIQLPREAWFAYGRPAS